MILRHVRILAVALVAGACLNTEPFPVHDYGILLARTMATETDTTTRPTATFFRAPRTLILPVPVTQDRCVVTGFGGSTGDENLNYISAGTSIMVELGGTEGELTPALTGNTVPSYELPADQHISFSPGDSITYDIPGAAAGFPPMLVRGPTTEPFTFETIVVSEVGGQPLSWTPPAAPLSWLIVSLRYAVSDAGSLNEQVICELVDDGSYTIPSELLLRWQVAFAREAWVERWRVRYVDTESATSGAFAYYARFVPVQGPAE